MTGFYSGLDTAKKAEYKTAEHSPLYPRVPPVQKQQKSTYTGTPNC